MKITLYIGSDETRKIDSQFMDKVHSILKKHFRGYTIQKSIGVWEDMQEESIEVIIFTDNLLIKELEACVDELKHALRQEKIIYTIEMIPWKER
ncbi:MAG: hypothetical protein V1839_03795 [archaeon]